VLIADDAATSELTTLCALSVTSGIATVDEATTLLGAAGLVLVATMLAAACEATREAAEITAGEVASACAEIPVETAPPASVTSTLDA
jgi:hypothetical protein